MAPSELNPEVQVIGLFPTPFMRVESLLDSMLCEQAKSQMTAVVKAKKGNSKLLSHTEVILPSSDELFQRVGKRVQPYLVEFGIMMFGEELLWSISGMWANVMETGGEQKIHNHANSFISGVIYLTHVHPTASTVFHKSQMDGGFVFANNHSGCATGPFNRLTWRVPRAAPGDLIIFPSYLCHEIPRNKGGCRMTIAFNAIPNRLKNFEYSVEFSA